MFRTALIAAALAGCSPAPPPAAPPAGGPPSSTPPAGDATATPAATPPAPAAWQCGGRRVIAFHQYGRAHVTQLDLKLWCEEGGPQVRDDSSAVHRPVSADAFDAAWKQIDDSTPWRTMKHDCGEQEGLASFSIEISDGSTTRRFECSDVEEAPANLAPMLKAMEAVAKELAK